MDLETANHYLWEVSREALLVERLHRAFLDAADAWLQAEHFPEPDGTVLWTSIDSERAMEAALEGIVAGYARISLFFFPSGSAGKRGAERAKVLRELANIDEQHPIADRDLRNHWMHLDERLDEFLESRGFVPIGFHLEMASKIPPAKRADYFRLVDPGTQSVYVLGKRFDLSRIAEAVRHAGTQAAVAIIGPRDDADAV
jgi:hypothetical protein